MILDSNRSQEGEDELKKVLGLQSIGLDIAHLLDNKSEKLGEFRMRVAEVFSPSESSEIFAIIASVAEKPKELLPFIILGNIQGFVDKVHQIITQTRLKEVGFYATGDGVSVRVFDFSKKGTLNLTSFPDGRYAIGGYR